MLNFAEDSMSRKIKFLLLRIIFQGPTCDSTDIICKDINLELLDIGDTLYFTSMGAYTLTLRTPFNGFDETLIFHAINSKDL